MIVVPVRVVILHRVPISTHNIFYNPLYSPKTLQILQILQILQSYRHLTDNVPAHFVHRTIVQPAQGPRYFFVHLAQVAASLRSAGAGNRGGGRPGEFRAAGPGKFRCGWRPGEFQGGWRPRARTRVSCVRIWAAGSWRVSVGRLSGKSGWRLRWKSGRRAGWRVTWRRSGNPAVSDLEGLGWRAGCWKSESVSGRRASGRRPRAHAGMQKSCIFPAFLPEKFLIGKLKNRAKIRSPTRQRVQISFTAWNRVKWQEKSGAPRRRVPASHSPKCRNRLCR